MRRWTADEDFKLTMLAMSGEYFYTEIAKEIGRSPQQTVWRATKKLGLPKKPCKWRMGHWNRKHAHLREPVMRYFLNHTWDETRKKFKLTQSELKSIFTVGYRDPKFNHLRKETRDHSPWTTRQYLTLLQNAGIRPRDYIARKIKRGNAHSCIKERFEKLGIASRTLNGMTLSSYRLLFGKEPRKYLKTDAGPGRGKYSSTYFKIIPWVQVNKDLKDRYVTTTRPMRIAIDAKAMFQEWIYQGEYEKKIKRRLVNAPAS